MSRVAEVLLIRRWRDNPSAPLTRRDKPPRERDQQRKRLYAAEEFMRSDSRRRIETVPEIQAYVNELCEERWFKKRWGGHHVVVKDGRGRRRACAIGNIIKMPRHARFEWVVLHEVAHTLIPAPLAWHGSCFANAYLELVRCRLGKATADKLETRFRIHRVRHTPRRESRTLRLRRQSGRIIGERTQA